MMTVCTTRELLSRSHNIARYARIRYAPAGLVILLTSGERPKKNDGAAGSQALTWLTRRMKLLNCSEGSLSGRSR